MYESKRSIPVFWLPSFMAAVAALVSYLVLDSQVQITTASIGFRGDVQELFDLIGSLGHGFFCLFVVVSIWFLDRRRRNAIVLIVASFLFAGGITSSIKSLIPRPRPAIVAGVPVDTTNSIFDKSQLQSFPSGHTTTAFALATALAMIYPHARGYFLGLAILVGLQRILTQAHYPSDVLMGATIGMLSAGLVANLFARYNPKWIAPVDLLQPNSLGNAKAT
jgi:membrane-associated phospholipid phosphatase